VTINAHKTGPSSRISEIATRLPRLILKRRKFESGERLHCETPPVKKPVKTMIVNDPTPDRIHLGDQFGDVARSLKMPAAERAASTVVSCSSSRLRATSSFLVRRDCRSAAHLCLIFFNSA